MRTSKGVALLMVGDELLDGRVAETNSHFLLARLAARGLPVAAVEVLPDRTAAIVDALRRHEGNAEAVVVSGGLGPTDDDLCREALAMLTGEELELDRELLRGLQERFERRGRPMADSNRRQAFRTPSGISLPNPVGTAPGLWHAFGGTAYVLLPGVPPELVALWESGVENRLVAHVLARVPSTVRLRTTQIPESTLADRVRAITGDSAGVDLAFCVARHGIDVLLRQRPGGEDPSRVAQRLRDQLFPHVFTSDDIELHEWVFEILREHRQTVCTAESCTGGLVAAELTSVPGSSEVFRGSIVAYDDELKTRLLGVEPALLTQHGAVSPEVARAMALGARSRIGADWAVALTGIAGPGGGTSAKPVGTVWLALAGPSESRGRLLRLAGNRELIRRWSVSSALDALRRALLDLPSSEDRSP